MNTNKGSRAGRGFTSGLGALALLSGLPKPPTDLKIYLHAEMLNGKEEEPVLVLGQCVMLEHQDGRCVPTAFSYPTGQDTKITFLRKDGTWGHHDKMVYFMPHELEMPGVKFAIYTMTRLSADVMYERREYDRTTGKWLPDSPCAAPPLDLTDVPEEQQKFAQALFNCEVGFMATQTMAETILSAVDQRREAAHQAREAARKQREEELEKTRKQEATV